ncbi:MAG: Gfo/Idh/MocA family protein, partial [Actinomycetota bacterium]
MNRVGVGVIGLGYWGPNLVRNFTKHVDCEVVAVADRDEQRLGSVLRAYPGITGYADGSDLMADERVEAVVIASPVRTHFQLAAEALERGKHVLVEKPLTATVKEAKELVALSRIRKLTLMVDHTFIYTGAVQKIRELISSGELGTIFYFDSVRTNLGLFQDDINVLWDLAPHDFSIMTHLIDKEPDTVSAVGASPVGVDGWSPQSVMYVAVRFSDGFLAHFHLNWLAPVKVRRTLVGGSKRMVIYDHLDPDFQVKVFDKGLDVSDAEGNLRARVQYRVGDMLAPKVDQTEGLENMTR